MADDVYYVYRGQSYSKGEATVMTLYEIRGGREVFIWDGYRYPNSPVLRCYPRKATKCGLGDGVDRPMFKIHENELVYERK